MGIKFTGIGDDFGGEKYFNNAVNNASFNIIKPLQKSEQNTGKQSVSSSASQSNEDRVKIEVEGYDTKSSKNHEPITDMPESIPVPPENGVSKKSLDGAEYYKKEYIEGSEEVKFPPMINPETGEYYKTDPMYRETIEYDDGTVITNIYEGDKLVKSIEDKYSGDPSNPQHDDTRDTTTFYYNDDGSVETVIENKNDQRYIEDIGWTDGLIPDNYTFYDEEGNAIQRYEKDEKTGRITENPEFKEKLRDFSLLYPGYNTEYQNEERRRKHSRDEERY